MPFPKANPMESLRTLMRLPSVTNVGSLTDQGLDIAQGLGEYEPGEADLMAAQEQTGGAVSREMLRKSAMQTIKQKLAAAAQAQQYKMAQDSAGHQRDLQKQELVNRGNQDVARINTEGKAAQAEAAARAKAEALDAMIQGVGGSGRSFSVSGVGGVGPQPKQGATSRQAPTDKMLERLEGARSSYSGFSPLSWAYEKFTGKPSGERSAYETAMADVIARGGGNVEDIKSAAQILSKYPGSLDQKIAAAQADESNLYDFSGLDHYEKENIAYLLGR